MPLFILFFIILPSNRMMKKSIMIAKKRKLGRVAMTNEVIKKYVGEKCAISTGSLGTSVVGVITNVSENWLEVQTKSGSELVNADFVVNIRIKVQK